MDQALSPKLLNLSQEQVEILYELFAQATATLAELKFNDPINDALRLRQHSALSGERECLRNLLRRDEILLANLQEALNAQLNDQPATTTEEN